MKLNFADNLDKCESLVRSKFQEIQNTDKKCITFPGQPINSENRQVCCDCGTCLLFNVESDGLFKFTPQFILGFEDPSANLLTV